MLFFLSERTTGGLPAVHGAKNSALGGRPLSCTRVIETRYKCHAAKLRIYESGHVCIAYLMPASGIHHNTSVLFSWSRN